MRICIFLFLTFLPLSIVTSEDYFRPREVFVLAGPMDEIDEGRCQSVSVILPSI
jgi:hypothetical protein